MEANESRDEQVRRIVREYSPVFISGYHEALRQVNNMINTEPQPFYTRTKANMLHNAMANQVKSHLFGDKRVVMNEEHDSLIIEIDGLFMGRFKKLDHELRPAKSSTDRSQAFVEAQLGFDFTEYNKTHRAKKVAAEIGYLINETWTDFIRLDIVCQHEHWSIPMNETSAGYFGQTDEQKDIDQTDKMANS